MTHSLIKSYVALVMLAAAAMTTWLSQTHPLADGAGWLGVLMWALAVGPQTVAFPKHRVQITAADCFMFYGLVAHGPLGAVVAAFVGTLGAMQLGDRKPSARQAAFNLGAVPLSAGIAAYFYDMFLDAHVLVSISIAAAGFAVVNTILVAGALKLEGKTNLPKMLKAMVPGFFASVFVTAIAGGMLAKLSQQGPGDWMVVAVIGVCFVVAAVLPALRKSPPEADEVA